ncbi:hypothetical protein EW145_g6425 [Phellinidium pouzarii]|uniref:Uncharacterized protein n=1 Tax=Phellinidium pouzarii TaxID=167371 RepID=A0A4S4L1C6_9AGAM|nr:hypothetical protein EW145_g6425 [Phellinidium pouzarii]
MATTDTPGASTWPLPSRTGFQFNSLRPTHASNAVLAVPHLPTQPPVSPPRDQETLSCTDTLDEVLLVISTKAHIMDYSSHYTATPIEQFRMTYTPLSDGSLVAPPYLYEIQRGNRMLLFVGMMLMLFLRNSVISVDYIRRGRVKFKGLFYALLISQLLAVATFALMATSFFAAYINCKIAFTVEGVLIEISAAILTASSALLFLDIGEHNTAIRFSMYCIQTSTPRFLPVSTALRFIIALFICSCFLYALWKSAKLPTAQGRISISQTPRESAVYEKGDFTASHPRGWWDYVPAQLNSCQGETHGTRAPTWHVVDDQGFVQNIRHMVGTWKNDNLTSEDVKQKERGTKLVPQRQSSKRSVVHFKDIAEDPPRFNVTLRPSSPTPSNSRSLRSLAGRMKLFREVMRNELAHTACIALFNVIATVLVLIGAFGHLSIPSEFFLSSYWAILSLLVIHNFGRVVERHEREALLQNPSSWDHLYHKEKIAGETSRHDFDIASKSKRKTPSSDSLHDEDNHANPDDIHRRKSDFSSKNRIVALLLSGLAFTSEAELRSCAVILSEFNF